MFADWLEDEASNPTRAAWARRVSAGLRVRQKLVLWAGRDAAWHMRSVAPTDDWERFPTYRWQVPATNWHEERAGAPADFPGLIEERPDLAESFFTRIVELAEGATL